jgi:hypothetical protein
MIPMAESAIYTVERRTVSTDSGQAVYTLAESFEVRASIQEVPGRVLQSLPEALRARALVYMIADLPPRLRQHKAPSIAADLVLYDGRRWEVASERPFGASFPLPHGEYVLALSETEQDPSYGTP